MGWTWGPWRTSSTATLWFYSQNGSDLVTCCPHLVARQVEDLQAGRFLRQLRKVVQAVEFVAAQVEGLQLRKWGGGWGGSAGPPGWWGGGVKGGAPSPSPHLRDVLLDDAQHRHHAAALVEHGVDALRHQICGAGMGRWGEIRIRWNYKALRTFQDLSNTTQSILRASRILSSNSIWAVTL